MSMTENDDGTKSGYVTPAKRRLDAAETREQCCVGGLSGWTGPDGIEARMCDDECGCESCLLSRDFGE